MCVCVCLSVCVCVKDFFVVVFCLLFTINNHS